MTKKESHIGVLIEHINEKVIPSFKNIRVLSYSLISVVIVGGAGVWLPWLNDNGQDTIFPGSTVFTYSLALLGSLICDKLYFYTKSLQEIRQLQRENVETEKIEDYFNIQEKNSILSAWGMLIGSLSILLIIVAYSFYYDDDSIVGTLGLASSIVLYIIASAPDLDKDSKVVKDSEDATPLITPIDASETIDANFFSNGD